MDWLHPTYFWSLLAVPVALALFGWAAWQRREAFRRFGQSDLVQRLAEGVSRKRRIWKASLTTLGVALLALALAGPRFGKTVREVERKGVDLIVTLDVSASMRAEDVAPSRLERAKREISELLNRLSGDRVGLVIFAGDAFIQCPLTSDYSAVRLFLDVASPDMLPTPGTNFKAALRKSLAAFDSANRKGEEARSKAVLFVSDGENHEEGLQQIVQRAQNQNVKLFAAGVGETEGAPIPKSGKQSGYKRNRSGEIVQTRLQPGALRSLAGRDDYYRIARTSSELSSFADALTRLNQTTFGKQMFEEYSERYQWPLGAGLLLLLGAGLIDARRRT
ncbi:MAG: hypothetical protein BRD45_04385 [Bacteroidetes bacterium QS_8_64_10]|nr:MAG: hypothetical protein BRD45_04385 [Bacteroidetes bacterium QS_8_64_10]